jgi:hypothetical protein
MTTAVDPQFYARHYPAEPEPFPAPLVTSRDPIPAGIVEPGPVAQLEAYAAEHGWQTQVAYSEGCLPHATHGRPVGPKKLWSVRLERNGARAVAVRHDDTWKSFWMWSPRRMRERAAGLEVFKVEIGRDW